MANSFQLFLRASIMIVTMVAIPLIAIFGKQIPEFFEAIWNGHERTTSWQARPTGPAPTDAAAKSSPMDERFASQQRRTDLEDAPKFVPGGATSPANTAATNMPATDMPSTLSIPAAPGMLPADAAPLSMAPLAGARNPTAARPISDPFVRPTAGNLAPPADSPVAVPSVADPTATDPLIAAQNKLRALGVGYFKLETTGEADVRYRCYCQVKSGDGPVQDFSSVQTIPLAAIHDVTGQIERWQATLKDRVGQGSTKLR